MISIVIPHHYEDKEKIKPLLTSINSQIGIDFNKIEVLLCSDVDISPLDDLDFAEYENIANRIKKIKSPYKNNIGLSRQAGLDEAIGEYVMFCDADDALFHLGVLRELEDNIKKSAADLYRFRFLEEVGSSATKNRTYITKDFNWIWVFSKAYKTEFVRKYNIRFSKNLKYHEDSYFNFILRYRNPQVVDIDSFPAYLWRYSDTSITRANDHEYSFVSWEEFIESLSLGFRKVIKEYGQNCAIDILTVAAKSYILLNNPIYNKFQGEQRERIERKYYEFLKEFIPDVFNDTINENITSVVTQIFFKTNPGFIPNVSWENHIKYLIEKYK